jgi:hypothetical protein
MTTFTPGPWRAVDRVGNRDILSGDRFPNERTVATVYLLDASDEANARLIAAAPELYWALHDITDNGLPICGPTCPTCGRDNAAHGDICTSDDCMGVQARAALAKADGRDT